MYLLFLPITYYNAHIFLKFVYERVYVYIDGASKGNPGKAAIGIIIKDCNGSTIKRYNARIGETTNNIAEYTALREALRLASLYSKNITVISDSKLLVNQMQRLYKVKSDGIKRLIGEVNSIIKDKGLVVEYRLVRREDNKEADALANEALDE